MSSPSPKASTSKKPVSKESKNSSEMNLVLGKLSDTSSIVQIEDNSFTVSGDIGCIGRLKVSKSDILLDVKGHMYSSKIVPCRSLLLLNVGGTDAKIEAVMNSFLDCTYTGNILTQNRLKVILNSNLTMKNL
ncbi:hypothetical protein GEMRC1_004054 [Eukaryota sp. GEM-RC1]